MMSEDLKGTKAKIVCLTEQLRQIGVVRLLPGHIVEIIDYDYTYNSYGPTYVVKCFIEKSPCFHAIPLKYLEIQN